MMFHSLRFGVIRLLGILSILMGITACGGGASSSASTTPAVPPISLSSSSGKLFVNEGTSVSITVTLILDSQVDINTAHVFVSNFNSAFLSPVEFIPSNDPRSVVVRLHTSPTLTVGNYVGSAAFIVCNSDPCGVPYSNIPAVFNCEILVTRPAAVLTPSAINISVAQGYPATVTLDAALASGLSANNNGFRLYDPQSRFSSTIFHIPKSADVETLMLSLSPVKDAPGTYTGEVSLLVCSDIYCGGLGNVTGSPVIIPYTITVTLAPPAVTLTPSTINVSVEQGDPATITIDATVASELSLGGYTTTSFVLSDPQGRFSSEVSYNVNPASTNSLTVQLLPLSGSPGTYSGTATLRVCGSINCYGEDDVPGSPIAIPYTISVTPFVPLAAIPTTTGLPEWETYQGNAGHTGYVPVTLNPTTFNERWTRQINSSFALSPVTTGSGKVVMSTSAYFAAASLIALDEADGSTAWQYDFDGRPFTVDDPAIFGGRVFVTMTDFDNHLYMYSFDANDGSIKYKTLFRAQGEHHLAPTIKDSYVYTNGGTSGGMYAFKARTGANKWFATLNQFDLWTPAVDDRYAYAYTGREFAAIDLATGNRAFSVADSAFNGVGYALNIAPVLSDKSALVVNGIFRSGDQGDVQNNSLISYSISGQSETWRANGIFASNPVVALGNIYLLNQEGNQLEARDGDNGSLIWKWQPSDANEKMPIGNLVLTNNLIFLSTSVATYAIDLTTHQSVWSVPYIGNLALSSNKVLYISSKERYISSNLIKAIRAYQLN